MTGVPLCDKMLSMCLEGRNVRVNVMQPLRTQITSDDILLPEKKSEAVLSRYRSSNAVPSSLPKVNVKTIPRFVATLQSAGHFETPEEYLKYNFKTNEEMDSIVEYEVDEDDVEWLRSFNAHINAEEGGGLSEASFEEAIDRMEKDCFFQCSKDGSYKPSVDQDAVCSVCNDGDGDNANQIIFCDMCNVPVHQDCYGVPYVPEGLWLCRKCQLSPSTPVSCVLCPNTHGAFKQTEDHRWAHVACAMWLDEVHFANTVFMEPIEGVERALKRRCKLRCLVCKQKVGACLQCSKKSCTRSFHVTCGLTAGMEMRIITVQNPKNQTGPEYKYTAFCHFHSASFATEDAFGKESKIKRKMDEQIKRAREKVQANQETAPPLSVPVVPPKSLETIRRKLGISDGTLHAILVYWTLKRNARCGVPLIRRLIQNHKQTPRAGLKTDEGSCREASSTSETRVFGHLRYSLERVRLLCELVKKREKLKKEYYVQTATLVNRCAKPLHSVMNEVLDKIASKDYDSVFAQPVTDRDVPGYSSVIGRPMDLSKMRRKLAKGEYRELAQLKADFSLMISNCSTFNRHNEYFWKYGHRLQRIGLKYFKAAEEDASAVALSREVVLSLRNIRLFANEVRANMERELAPVASMVSASLPPRPSSHRASAVSAVHARRSLLKRKRTVVFSPPLSPMKKRKTSELAQEPITRLLCEKPIKRDRNVMQKLRRRSRVNKENKAFSLFRESSIRNMMNSPTDNSAEENSATEESPVPRPRRTGPRITRSVAHHLDTVEIGADFQHDDIVWVDTDEGRTVGRIIDLRMKVLLDDLPIDDMMSVRPQDYTQFSLVLLFDKKQSWRWIPSRNIQLCDLPVTECNSFSPSLQSAINDALIFRAKYLRK